MQIWLQWEQTVRSRSRVDGWTKEHENYDSELKDICQDHSASYKLQDSISFLIPDEEHLGGFSQMGFYVISYVQVNDLCGEILCDWLIVAFRVMLIVV